MKPENETLYIFLKIWFEALVQTQRMLQLRVTNEPNLCMSVCLNTDPCSRPKVVSNTLLNMTFPSGLL